MKVKIKKINENAAIPSKTHDSDFCYDVVAMSEIEVAPDVWRYGLGFAIELEKDTDDDSSCCITLRPRSSIYKTGMVLSNGEGTIDFDFRGEVCAIFYHVMKDMPRYKVGDKIAQIHVEFSKELEFEVVDELSYTERGTGGYGSTGK